MTDEGEDLLAKYRLDKSKIHLKSARDLIACDDYLDSVSRSYYAILTAARALLATKRLDSQKHYGVISLFNQHFVKTSIVSNDCGQILKEANLGPGLLNP